MTRRAASIALFSIILIATFLMPQEKPMEQSPAHTESVSVFTAVLDEYINLTLENNLDISLLRRNVEGANADRKEAFSEFLPKLSFQSRYSVAGGGRKIIIDINQFVGGMFPGMQFPVIEESFIRPHEQETKINATQVLFAGGAVLNGYNAKSSMYDASVCNLESVIWNKRLETTEAYLNYLKAVELVKIKERVLNLSKEGYDITDAIFRQDKLLKSDLMRSKVNVFRAESDLAEAQEQKRLAQRFFNNLLNRDVFGEIKESVLTYDDAVKLDIFMDTSLDDHMKEVNSFEAQALGRRSEIASLDHTLDAISRLKNIAFSEYLPKVILSMDYGWQGEEYSFTGKNDYYMASLVFQLNLFDGFRREARMEKAAFQLEELEIQKLIAMKNIGLQVEQAYLKLRTSRKQIQAAVEQLASAEENYRIVQKRYALGMALSLDMNDALAQLDIAGSTNVIALYDYVAAIERMKNVLGSGKKECQDE
jgi:outer membrane protein TolC